METKRCTKCGEVKGLEEFYKAKNLRMNLGCFNSCKVCMKAANSAYQKANRDKINKQKSLWRRCNRDKEVVMKQNYALSHADKLIDIRRRTKKKGVDELSDAYVKSRLDDFGAAPELIEMKRQQLLAHRALKEFQKLLKEQTK